MRDNPILDFSQEIHALMKELEELEKDYRSKKYALEKKIDLYGDILILADKGEKSS